MPKVTASAATRAAAHAAAAHQALGMRESLPGRPDGRQWPKRYVVNCESMRASWPAENVFMHESSV